jgi:uncharacterized protein YgiM (DUF1202 family)
MTAICYHSTNNTINFETTTTLSKITMPSMDLTQTLNKKKSFIRITADQNESLINQLENEIANMEREYYFMDHPIKTTKPTLVKTQETPIILVEPPSPTLTIDKILLSLFADD